MSITGPGPIQGGFPIRPSQQPVSQPSPVSEGKTLNPTDEVEFSSAGQMLEQLHNSGQLHAERLAELKAAIDAGEYETPEKLQSALTRMLAEIQSDISGNGA